MVNELHCTHNDQLEASSRIGMVLNVFVNIDQFFTM